MRTTPININSQGGTEVAPRRLKAPVHAVQSSPKSICSLCHGPVHSLYMYPSFKGMSVEARSRHIKGSNSCFNCLGVGHRTRECKSTNRCKTCAKSHQTLLHRAHGISESNNQAVVDSSAGPTNSSPSSSADPTPHPSAGPAPSASTDPTTGNADVSECSVNHVTPNSTIQASLSMTSKVVLEAPSGKEVVARALLDSGAGLSLISQRVVQQLELPKTSHPITISGVMGTKAGSGLMCELPLTGANHLKDLVHLKDLELADPLFYKPGKIDVLLGCNVYQDLLLSSTKKGSSDKPVAVETIFDWAVMGLTLHRQLQSST